MQSFNLLRQIQPFSNETIVLGAQTSAVWIPIMELKHSGLPAAIHIIGGMNEGFTRLETFINIVLNIRHNFLLEDIGVCCWPYTEYEMVAISRLRLKTCENASFFAFAMIAKLVPLSASFFTLNITMRKFISPIHTCLDVYTWWTFVYLFFV